mgnify:CR=1 FL=1
MEILGFSILHPVVGPQGSCPAGRHQSLADGEGEDHKEGRPDLSILDGLLERRWEGPKCPPGELQEGGPRDRPAESTEDEEGGPGAL